MMSRIPVWLSCLFCHKRRHRRESRHPAECITKPDPESSAVARLDKVSAENLYSTADEQDSSTAVGLDKLPVEIFQCIMDFLPLDSVACLILSRKRLVSAIGERTWLALQANRKERLDFLLTMQRDWQEWVICYSCAKLHHLKKCPSLETGRNYYHENPCTMADGVVELTSWHILRWHHAHMMMRLNTQNPMDHNWIQALSCNRAEYKELPWVHCRGRIANNHLLLKMEYRILLRKSQDMIGTPRFIKICPHWNSCDLGYNFSKKVRKMFECSMEHETTDPCLLCNAIIECCSCTTEFVISVVKCDGSHCQRAVYITAWKDLGSCESPSDNCWRTQCWHTYSNFKTCFSLFRERVPYYEPGSIRNAYEELGYPKLKDDGTASRWPLASDLEHHRRLERCSKPDSVFSKIIRGEILDT